MAKYGSMEKKIGDGNVTNNGNDNEQQLLAQVSWQDVFVKQKCPDICWFQRCPSSHEQLSWHLQKDLVTWNDHGQYESFNI